MVDNIGHWYEEEDYDNYPINKWCDYDIMCIWIRSVGYEPKTTMENLITMSLLYGETHFEEIYDETGEDYTYNNIHDWIMENGGYEVFDYYA